MKRNGTNSVSQFRRGFALRAPNARLRIVLEKNMYVYSGSHLHVYQIDKSNKNSHNDLTKFN